jgi:hypothetical protein
MTAITIPDAPETEAPEAEPTPEAPRERTISDLILDMGDVAVALKKKGIPWPETTKLIDQVLGYALAKQQMQPQQPFGFPGVDNSNEYPTEDETDGSQ